MDSLIEALHPTWQADALCAEHPEVNFWPERGERTDAAKALCRCCLVREECLDYALELDEGSGIWGGTSGRERKALRAPRRRRPAA